MSKGADEKISLGLIMWCLLAAAGQAAELPEPSGLINDFTGRVDQTSLATLKAKVARLKAQEDLEIGIAVAHATVGNRLSPPSCKFNGKRLSMLQSFLQARAQ